MTLTREQFLLRKRDYSASLVHLTRSREGASAFEVLLQILTSREIRAFRNHCLFKSALPYLPPDVQERFNVACLSECPPEFLGDLVAPVLGRAFPVEPYGVAVRMEAVVVQQGNPVLYAASPAYHKFWDVWNHLVGQENWEVLSSIMPLVSIIKERNDFYWEREWRVPGGLRIDPESAPFIVCPEDDIDRLQHELYLSGDDDWAAVPMIDAAWSRGRIARELAPA